jgi:GT2 family glycosyltransferase
MTRAAQKAGHDLPAFSIVMPTYQRRSSLRRTLESLSALEYPSNRLDLVLVCDGCTDGSAEMAGSLQLPFPLRVLEQPNLGPAAARNFALAHARGPYVLFLDDDVLASPGMLVEHARAHLDAPGEERVVIGSLLPHSLPPSAAEKYAHPVLSLVRQVWAGRRAPWVQWEFDTVVREYAAMEAGEYRPSPRQFFTGNASLLLKHVTAVGGFDVDFRRAEDVELAFRLQARGLRFVFWPAASGLHIAERSFQSWFDAAYQYGRKDVILGLERGRPDMLGAMASGFWWRHTLNRLLVRCVLRAPGYERATAGPAVALAWLALLLGLRPVSHAISSALFNAAYWHGAADQLGGPAAARELIDLGARPGELDWPAIAERLRPAQGRVT